MKSKIVFALMSLAGSAFSQLIPVREESGFLASYGEASPLAFALTYDGAATAHDTRSLIPASLSLRNRFPATTALVENSTFATEPQRSAVDPVSTAAEASAPTVLDFAFFTADSRAQSDSFPTNQDQGVLALIAASTNP